MSDMGGAQGGNFEQAPSPEPLEGLRVLSFDELDAGMEEQILSLEYNALDTGKKHNFAVRNESIKPQKLYTEHLQQKAHGDVLVAVDGERVIGVLTLNRENSVGKVDDIWLRGEHHQEAVIAQLLERAREDMHNGAVRCDSATIEAGHPSEDFRRVYHHMLSVNDRTFYSIESKDN